MTPPTPPLLLALVAPSGAGEDTAAAYLAEHYAFIPIAFADPLRHMLAALLAHVELPVEHLTDPARKHHPIPILGHSYHSLARTLGTSWGRCAVAADFWLRIAEHHRAQAMDHCGDNVVITDLRHHNELRWVQRHGGHVVAIDRDGKRFHPLDHSSEQEAQDIAAAAPHRIANHSTLAHLHDQLDVLMDNLRTRATSNPAGITDADVPY